MSEAVARPRRIISRITSEPVSKLTAADRDDMFALFARYYDKVDRATFDADLDGKQRLIRLLDKEGKVAGFTTIQLIEGHEGKKKTLVLFSGDTVVDRDCWGQKSLQVAFSRELLKIRLSNLGTRFYWFLISKGHKTYLLMRNNFTMYPSRDGPTPPEVQATLDRVSRLKFGDRYDAARGVIVMHEGSVKPDAADIPTAEEMTPDVRFFLEKNPGWVDGEELCCLAQVRLRQLIPAVIRYTLIAPFRRFFRKKRATLPVEKITAGQ